LVWHVKAIDGQFVTNGHFLFFPFFSLSYPKKYMFILFIFGISISFLILLISDFCS